ncbi:hypothetical protein KEM52_005395 [Ascosphaera acerosa]|nr:hypothetical protein KEM52_005395 [Ascosphaera acerosa]
MPASAAPTGRQTDKKVEDAGRPPHGGGAADDDKAGGDVAFVELPYIDRAVEKRVLRKLDCRLPVVTGLLYKRHGRADLVAFLDRSNIGNAKIAGMEEALNLDSGSYNWLLTIFYISYVLFEGLAFMWKVVPPHVWAATTVAIWGIASTCQAAAQSWRGLMALRFLMGAAEAGFGPGVPFLFSFFYSRRELGFRSGLFLSAAPLANCFAGALASGITSARGARLAPWRLLFLVEGALTCLVAPLAFFGLPDSAASARFLTDEERAVARARALQRTGDDGDAPDRRIDWRETARTLMSVRPWLTAG